MTATRLACSLLLSLVLAPAPALAQQPAAPGYGPNIRLDAAKAVAAAAIAEAKKNAWTVVVAIVDTGGHLVYLERLDDTQVASVDVAIAKAWSANGFKRATKLQEDTVLGGRTVTLKVPGAMPVEGGLPLIVDGKIVGAIGVSGVASQQDGVVAAAGVAALK